MSVSRASRRRIELLGEVPNARYPNAFRLIVDRRSSPRLGLRASAVGDSHEGLRVFEVLDGGALANHRAEIRRWSDHLTLRSEDVIRSVNGDSDIEGIRWHLNNSPLLHIAVERPELVYDWTASEAGAVGDVADGNGAPPPGPVGGNQDGRRRNLALGLPFCQCKRRRVSTSTEATDANETSSHSSAPWLVDHPEISLRSDTLRVELVVEVMANAECPMGHSLRVVRALDAGFRCAACTVEYTFGVIIVACVMCDHQVCQSCHREYFGIRDLPEP